ncbi:TIGR03756 family integrating conjugative element protein [Pseudomonas sp. Y39-6]|uniref:TIGR03756 family integrating conjugative element protein n=1 Tax=Pseudomonas sp. Y39-6 TaxID=2749807 RepID=UPI00191100CB|nr:TIGR03756 family integrating conjugative element protein [Pseudomonas sp. Y39-6]QPO21997.1 TIGR03756 family integrating conjugative element protein [Pseudomonas sp. Y39-6]URS59318.1 TIGR03756 family integrating conjugative element protein [Pseudomonas sp. Y39-6]
MSEDRKYPYLIAIAPLLLTLTYSPLSQALNTAIIVPTVISPSCLEYKVVGACFWLRCTNFGCKVKTSAKVRHYVPDAVVSSYSSTGQNPWSEVRALSSPISHAKGGGSGTTNDQHENNLSIFKNVDVIGHPGIAAFNAFASGSGYACAGAGTPYVPNMLSTLDYVGWRYGIPESIYPQSLIPGIREVGSRLSLNLWGNIYPRSGFLHQVDDYKASAVMAQRAGDIVTRPGQVHVYQPLLASPSAGYWPAGELRESEPATGKWQQLAPRISSSCNAFPESGPHLQAIDGGYAWSLWRPYTCCKREGQTFLGSTGPH